MPLSEAAISKVIEVDNCEWCEVKVPLLFRTMEIPRMCTDDEEFEVFKVGLSVGGEGSVLNLVCEPDAFGGDPAEDGKFGEAFLESGDGGVAITDGWEAPSKLWDVLEEWDG